MSQGRGKHRQSIKQTSGGTFSRFTKNKGKDADDDLIDNNKRRQQQQQQQQGQHRVMITGFPMDTKKESLLGALQNASKIPLSPIQFSIDSKHAMLHLQKKLEVNALLNLSGLHYNGSKLTILSLKNGRLPPQIADNQKNNPKKKKDKSKEDKMLLEIFIQQIYDHANHALDLGDLKGRIPKVTVSFQDGRFVETLFRILKDKTPAVSTISFARNGIANLSGFDKTRSLGLRILNLSFDQNDIRNLEGLKFLKSLNLRELVLTNNPVSQKTEPFEYRKKIARSLPDLQLIDGYDIKLNSFVPICRPYCDTPITQSFADGFITRFLEACDTNRSFLIHVYADNAVFSLTTFPPKAKTLSSYSYQDRNLASKNGFDNRVPHLLIGKQQIVQRLAGFPETTHKREGMLVDAFMVKGINNVDLITIKINGEWREKEGGLSRQYSRTLLLAPAPPNSSALANGLQAVILNDLLHIAHPRKFPAVNMEAPPTHIAGPSTESSIAMKQQMVIRFSDQTGMNLTFSEQCLVGNQWDYEKSLINFNELKSTNAVPPEAFIK